MIPEGYMQDAQGNLVPEAKVKGMADPDACPPYPWRRGAGRRQHRGAELMQSYISQITGWVAGRRVSVGDLLVLTEDQARYEPVTPVVVEPADDEPAPKQRRRK